MTAHKRADTIRPYKSRFQLKTTTVGRGLSDVRKHGGIFLHQRTSDARPYILTSKNVKNRFSFAYFSFQKEK